MIKKQGFNALLLSYSNTALRLEAVLFYFQRVCCVLLLLLKVDVIIDHCLTYKMLL